MGVGQKRLTSALVLALAVTGGATSPALAADGRAWELVSPPDKAGNAVDVRTAVQSSADGDSVAYSLPGAVSGSPTSVSGGFYISGRSGSGWAVDPIDPPQLNGDTLVSNPSLFLSNDLSRVIQFSRIGLAPGAVDGGSNLYLQANATHARTLVAAAEGTALGGDLAGYGGPFFQLGASSDLTNFAFTTYQALTPDAAPGTTNVYEWADGTLRLVNVLPDGSVDPGGAQIFSNARAPRPVSADGDRVFFQSPVVGFGGDGPLYVRLDGTRTVALSVSRRVGDPDTPREVRFAAASRNGEIVYFTSINPLTPEAGTTGSRDLYRYDFATDELRDLSVPTDPADDTSQVTRVNEVSEDGAYAYFTSTANLTGGGVSGQPNLYVAHDDQLRLIGTMAAFESIGPPRSAISADGRYIGFASSARLTSADTTSDLCRNDIYYQNGDGNCVEMYVYDAVEGTLDCASCAPVDGKQRFADLGPQVPSISKRVGRMVLDDGRVYFNSFARLTEDDINGRRDVYEWNDGELSLISSGRSPQESTIAEVSADGRDVFFFTNERLVKADFDDEVDLYDARVGGGIAAQNQETPTTAGCSGEGCQGPLLTPSVLPQLGSVDFSAPVDEDDPTPPVTRRPTVTTVARGTVKGAAFSLKVRTSGAGRVTVSGQRLRSVSKTVAKAGTSTVVARLTANGKKALKRKRKLVVRVRVAYTPKSGAATSTIVRVTFKA